MIAGRSNPSAPTLRPIIHSTPLCPEKTHVPDAQSAYGTGTRCPVHAEPSQQIVARATANKTDRKICNPCIEAVLALLTTHQVAKADGLPILDRLTPLAEGDDRDAKANKAKIDAKCKELERSRL
jgi:hypothetical protein